MTPYDTSHGPGRLPDTANARNRDKELRGSHAGLFRQLKNNGHVLSYRPLCMPFITRCTIHYIVTLGGLQCYSDFKRNVVRASF